MSVLVRGVVVGETAPSDIVVEKGRVVSVSTAGRTRPDLGSRTALIGPTLFDIQVNGVMGLDLQSPALRAEDVRAITDCLARWGVSRWAPTIITGPPGAMARGCRVIAEAMQDRVTARAVAGIHLEGPCISPEDGPRGAHSARYVRRPDLRAFDKLCAAAGGHVLYTTVAPELPGAVEYIRGVVDRGITVSLGHHNATREQIARAVDAGARMCTHLGNGLGSMIHRHNNPLWPQLAEDRLAASVIADLQHLPAQMLKAVVRAKGPDRTVLASDAVHIAGLPPGQYALGGLAVELLPTGRICLSGTDLLAGSSLMLLEGVVNAANAGAMTLAEAFASATRVPSRLLGVKHATETPAVGRKAEFVVFHTIRGRVRVDGVFIGGEKRFEKSVIPRSQGA